MCVTDQVWFLSLPPLSFVGQVCAPACSCLWLPPFLLPLEKYPWPGTLRDADTLPPHTRRCRSVSNLGGEELNQLRSLAIGQGPEQEESLWEQGQSWLANQPTVLSPPHTKAALAGSGLAEAVRR